MTLGGRLALLFVLCGAVGAGIGAVFGSPGHGAVIGLAVPAFGIVLFALLFWVFIKLLRSLLDPSKM